MPTNNPSLEAEFKRFATDPTDVLEGVLLVSRLVEPATDMIWCRRELARLAARVAAPPSPVAVVEMLHSEGFAGAEDYYETRNSALQFVLNARRGIPISLAAVVIGVGKQLALDAHGINFPGHFLVTLERQLIDPYSLELLDDAERARRAAASGVPVQSAFRAASASEIVFRMLNNLRGLAVAQNNHALALEYTDYQLLLTADTFVLRLVRADLWHELGAPRMAGIELKEAAALAPNAQVRREIEARRAQLAQTRPTLH